MISQKCAAHKHKKCKDCTCKCHHDPEHVRDYPFNKLNVIPFPGLEASMRRHPAGRLLPTTTELSDPLRSLPSNESSLPGTEKVSTVTVWDDPKATFCSGVLQEIASRQIPICTHLICWISFLGWVLNIQQHSTLGLPLITTPTWSSDRCMNQRLPEFILTGEQLLDALGVDAITFSSDPPNGSA